MNLFKKLFKKDSSEENNDTTTFKPYNKEDCHTLTDLIEQNAGLSFEKQIIFADVIGENSWNLDMSKGTISFGDLEFPIQIIGSLAFESNSWMWGWANTQSGMPEDLLIQSNQLKSIGEQKGITELTDGHFNVEEGFEHKIGMLACGIFTSKSYYCADYGQGTLVVTIQDEKIPEVDKNKLETILTNFPQLISGLELNHKKTFLNYLIDREFTLKVSSNKIEGLKNEKVLVAEFDELNRLTSLNGTV